LQAQLAAHNTPCPACNYNLRGTPGDHCPECGVALTFPLRPRSGGIAWAIGLAGMLLTYSLLVIVLIASILVGNFLFGIVAIVFLIGAKRNIRRWRRTRRAFASLLRHHKQQRVAAWWLAPAAAAMLLWLCIALGLRAHF
jgi:hypothetical protein